jgi:hypothetical protein
MQDKRNRGNIISASSSSSFRAVSFSSNIRTPKHVCSRAPRTRVFSGRGRREGGEYGKADKQRGFRGRERG